MSFGPQASDATSGLGSGYEWSFGDDSAAGPGESVNHTFTQAGTYEVRVRTADAAGNPGTATKVVTVSAPTGGGNTGGGNTGGGNTGGGSTGGGSTGGGSTGGGTTDTGGGSADDTSDDAEDAEAGGFEVTAPRKLRLARAKALPIALSADTGGKVSVALVRSGRVIARGSKVIGTGTTSYRLKLPRKAKAGRHVLKVTFTPSGGEADTTSIKVTLTGKAGKARAATASAAGNRARVSDAGAPVVLPDGRFHGERKRSFAPRAVLAGR